MRRLFWAVPLMWGCVTSSSSMRGLSNLTTEVVSIAFSAVSMASHDGTRTDGHTAPEADASIETLMERSRRMIAADRDGPSPAHCHATVQPLGPRTWRVDSCDEHLRCTADPKSKLSCVAMSGAE